MNIYVDIDGTLTESPQVQWGKVIGARITAVKRLISDGHTVVLWTGGGQGYAEAFAKRYSLPVHACMGKPDIIVDDNETVRPLGNFQRVDPEYLDLA